MYFRSLALGLLGLVASPSLSWGADEEILRKSFRGKSPPEIVSNSGHWLGTSPPTALADMKGKVVWLQFNF